MNDENELDEIEDTYTVERLSERLMRENIVEVFKHLKIGKALGPSEVYAEMILTSGEIRLLIEFCKTILNEKEIREDWAVSLQCLFSKEMEIS